MKYQAILVAAGRYTIVPLCDILFSPQWPTFADYRFWPHCWCFHSLSHRALCKTETFIPGSGAAGASGSPPAAEGAED